MFSMYAITGWLERQEDTTHVVNLWYIPGGYRYDAATPINIFYSDEEEAKRFADKWDQIPEMAILMTIERHDELAAKAAKRQAERLEYERAYA